MNKEQLQDFLQSLTLEEKIKMVHGATLFKTGAIPDKNIPAFTFSDGPMGVRLEYEKDMWFPVAGNDDFCSYLPCNSAMAATFNRERAYETGQVLGMEARGRGKDMILAPGINIQRTPLGGRNFEYMSEDPCLTGETAVPFINGIQESDVAACVKHFALNNQETNRTSYQPDVSERALWEIYFPAFRLTVQKGHTLGMMGAYNKYKDVFLCHQKELINDILHHEWDFDGICVSDWAAVQDTEKAAACEVDVEMGVSNKFDEYYFANPLKEAILNGTVKMEDLDLKIRHILDTMNRLNMLDGNRCPGGYNLPESREKLLRTAEESIVLLKNDSNLLPLDPAKIKKLVVIGDNADRTHADGGGSSEIKALFELSPLMGIKMLLGGNCEVVYEPGYYNYVIGNAWIDQTSQNATSDFAVYKNNSLRQNQMVWEKEKVEALNLKYKKQALEACKDADAVIFIGGLNHDHDVEGRDRSDYNLPYDQDNLIREILKIRPDAIISLVGGSPVSMENWIAEARTVLYAYYGGMESGYAFARVLFGKVSPSGKLPTTFPKKLSDSPAHSVGEFPGDEHVSYKEDIYVGYRYFDTFNIEPEFAFGYGLSYADFVYIDLTLKNMQGHENTDNDSMLSIRNLAPVYQINFKVVNTSEIDAMESVQIYLSPLEQRIENGLQRPVKELRAFDKKLIPAGGSVDFSFELNAYDFTYYDETHHCYVAPCGNYEILVGSASSDIRLQQTITLEKDYKVSRS